MCLCGQKYNSSGSFKNVHGACLFGCHGDGAAVIANELGREKFKHLPSIHTSNQAPTPRPLAWGNGPGGCRWYCIFDLASGSSGRFYSINSSQDLQNDLPQK